MNRRPNYPAIIAFFVNAALWALIVKWWVT
jgi:hypothetical protein